jgi:hypothetical protein
MAKGSEPFQFSLGKASLAPVVQVEWAADALAEMRA